MDTTGERRGTRRRWIGPVAITAVLAVMVATPAGAHVTRNLGHLVGHLTKTFYTKAASNARYYTKVQANRAFRPARILVDTPVTGDAAYPSQGVNVLSIHELRIVGHCETSGPTFRLRLVFTSSVPGSLHAAFARASGDADDAPTSVRRATLPAGTGRDVIPAGGLNFSVSNAEGQFVYGNANRVITIVFHALVDNEAKRCHVTGTATAA